MEDKKKLSTIVSIILSLLLFGVVGYKFYWI